MHGDVPRVDVQFLFSCLMSTYWLCTMACCYPRLLECVVVVGGSVAKDDIHLILEYQRDTAWGPYLATRANRFVSKLVISRKR